MEKVVIIGSSGAGKTMLAKKLGRMLGMKVFHMDRFFWKRDWKKKDNDTRIDILQRVVMERQWIIEGSYFGTSELRLNEADTIIFLDIHPCLCLQRVIKRHYKYHGLFRRDIPEGCTDRLTLLGMLEVLCFSWLKRRKLVQTLHNYKLKQVIWLRSPKAVEDFLMQLEQSTNRRKTSKVAFDTGEKLLVASGW
jgi:adenylate kinase family enzyme